jgi:nicotinate-nucleotide adenylyltransferase
MIGLFFGSFNPIHKGHISVARAALDSSALAEIWFVVSPRNPFKNDKELAPIEHRVEMLRGALLDEPRMKCSDIELTLPTPSFTATTLDHLKVLHPDVEFVLIVGWDTYLSMPHWHRAAEVMQHKKIIYPRKHDEAHPSPTITGGILLNQPLLDISATDVRRKIGRGESCVSELETHTIMYIEDNRLYH